VLKYLSAAAVENGILSPGKGNRSHNLASSSTARTGEGERVKLNPELIMSKVGPGG
jgi:hypothetical protein